MNDSKLLGIVRKAIDDFLLIDEGDCIAVGLSGGKDSMTMLYALSKIKEFYPKKYCLKAVMIDLGFSETDKERVKEVKEFCESLNVPLTIVPTDIGYIVFDKRNEKNPCSLCAKLRRGALNKYAKELGCNKVALAHSMDDFIETMMLSLVYEGRISTIQIKSYLTNSELFVIRPLFYADERQIIEYAKTFPILHNPCPSNKRTKRQYVKELIRKIDGETDGGRGRIKRAVIDLVKEQNKNGEKRNWKE